MKIESGQPYNNVSSLRKRRQVSSSSGFGGLLDAMSETSEAETTEQAAPSAPVSDIGQMLMIQEVSDEEANRKKAIRTGHMTLDALEKLRLSILFGEVTEGQLLGMRQLVQRQRSFILDPHLRAVLDDIELRVAVELAKYSL